MAKEIKLKPCKCGSEVEVKYIAGISPSLLKYIQNPFASTIPTYYIVCKNCGENMAIRITQCTVECRDKCKRKLIRDWNKSVNGNA